MKLENESFFPNKFRLAGKKQPALTHARNAATPKILDDGEFCIILEPCGEKGEFVINAIRDIHGFAINNETGGDLSEELGRGTRSSKRKR